MVCPMRFVLVAISAVVALVLAYGAIVQERQDRDEIVEKEENKVNSFL